LACHDLEPRQTRSARAGRLLTAVASMSILPPLLIFFGLPHYFVRGILAGSVKGQIGPG
jgi:ABC-type glycerol-3-phosphate transport system permease component